MKPQIVVWSKGYLHVGYRLLDWTDVWYKPEGTAGPNQEYHIGLYSGFNKVTFREPKEVEVAWQPHFDPGHFEAKKPSVKRILQKRFLSDIHCYISGRADEALVKTVEGGAVNGRNIKMKEVYAKAVKVKARLTRDAARKKAGGLRRNLPDHDSTYNSSDSDSDPDDDYLDGATGKVRNSRKRNLDFEHDDDDFAMDTTMSGALPGVQTPAAREKGSTLDPRDLSATEIPSRPPSPTILGRSTDQAEPSLFVDSNSTADSLGNHDGCVASEHGDDENEDEEMQDALSESMEQQRRDQEARANRATHHVNVERFQPQDLDEDAAFQAAMRASQTPDSHLLNGETWNFSPIEHGSVGHQQHDEDGEEWADAS